MNQYSLFHLADGALERGMLELFAEERRRTALLVAFIAEFDERRLYARDGYPTMHAWCVDRVKLSDDAARKRIQAAQAARRYPVLFEALADGRLHLTAVVLLAPRLDDHNVAELVAEATHRTVEEIRLLIARHFPKEDVPVTVRSLGLPAPGRADGLVLKPAGDAPSPGANVTAEAGVVLKPLAAVAPRVAPLSEGRFETRFTIGEATHAALRQAEELLGRRLRGDELDAALGIGLAQLIATLEKRRYATTDRPRRTRGSTRGNARGRRIPAAVKREVAARDGHRCTYVSPDGRRCAARGRLEYDHVVPVARGGTSTVANLRLRCRAHNQYEAEQVFGAGFMHEKRERARRAAKRETGPANAPRTAKHPKPRDEAIVPCLRQLGFRADELKRAAEHCATLGEAPLEQRVREALRLLAPRVRVEGVRTQASHPG